MAVLRRHKAGLGAVLSKLASSWVAAAALALGLFMLCSSGLNWVQVRDMSWYFQATSCPQGGPLPVGRLWPGTIPMESPSRATYDKLQADPALVERDAEALAEFEAAPWLLPTRSKVLPYAGVHDLERLLKLRSTAIGPYNKTITVVLFSKNASVMAQNAIYSMVKFGGVRNFIVGTWSQEGLDVCADLNLPCADVAAHLPEPLENPSSGEFYSGHDYLVVKWLRRTLVLHLLQQGYAVLYVDADVSWVMKPLWESHIKFVDEYGADGAVQIHDTPRGPPTPPDRSGNFFFVPRPGAISGLQALVSNAQQAIKEGMDDDTFITERHNDVYHRCPHFACVNERAGNNQQATIRAYLSAQYLVSDDVNALCKPDPPLLDFCVWTAMFLHPPCAGFLEKAEVYKKQGIWWLDDSSCTPKSGASQVLACQPLRWREAGAELMLYSCREYGLALTRGRRAMPSPPPAPQVQGPAQLAMLQ